MSHIIADSLLSELSAFIASRLGLHFPRGRWRDLERAIILAAEEFACHDPESCVRWLLSSPLTRRQIETLSAHLTVGETYFFREKRSFESLESSILPGLIRARRDHGRCLRIWSAGCSTGEEPYSISILLAEMLPDWNDWNITILATDINPVALGKASHGVYKEWSFRDIAPRLKERYFARTNEGHFEIASRIKQVVKFDYLNLADDAYPALETGTNAMDIIFCRNVLMYFEPGRAKTVIQGLYHALIDGGWLIVSPAEASHTLFPQFVTRNFPGAILYQKVPDQIRENLTPIPSVQLESASISRYSVPYADVESSGPFGSNTGPFPRVEASMQVRERPEPSPHQEATVLYEQGRYVEAAEKINEVLSRNPGNAKAMVLLARIYANQGALGEALHWCERAVSADKLNPEWRYLLATVLLEQGRTEEALAALKRTLYLNPDYALAHFAIGNLSRRHGKIKEFARHYQNALAILRRHSPEHVPQGAAGMTSSRLMEIIQSALTSEAISEL